MEIKRTENKYLSVYGDIAKVLSRQEDIEKIYALFRGQTVSFPKKLYSQEYICDNYGNEKRRDKEVLCVIDDGIA